MIELRSSCQKYALGMWSASLARVSITVSAASLYMVCGTKVQSGPQIRFSVCSLDHEV